MEPIVSVTHVAIVRDQQPLHPDVLTVSNVTEFIVINRQRAQILRQWRHAEAADRQDVFTTFELLDLPHPYEQPFGTAAIGGRQLRRKQQSPHIDELCKILRRATQVVTDSVMR